MAKSPDKLSIVVYSGDFGRVHYAFSMAAAAVAVDRPATLFFTMEAIRALAKVQADGSPGWHALPGAASLDAGFVDRGVATFEELVSAGAALGVVFQVCEMGLRAVDMTVADLRDDLTFTEGGIVTFLNDASADGSMLFI